MTHAARFRKRLFTELRFGIRHLKPLRLLYRQLRGDRLGPRLAFNEVPGLHGNMSWFYAANRFTLEQFGHCLNRSNLRRCFSIVGGEPELLAACFIVVRNELPPMDFHVDYGEKEIPEGVTSTMLTPLFEFDDRFGHLEYKQGEERSVYRYRTGDAILFDGKFEHRSQEFHCEVPAERVLVSWSIASLDRRYRHAVRRVIDSQAK